MEKENEDDEIIPLRKAEVKVRKIESNIRENTITIVSPHQAQDIKETDKNLFDYGFDVMMLYDYYFPENNWTNILRKLWKSDMLMKKRSLKR